MIELRADVGGEPAWFVGKRSQREILALEKRKQCYLRAQQSLEEISNTVALSFPANTDADNIAALFTPDYRRPDNLQGIFRFLYLAQIAEALAKELDERCIRVTVDCPSWFVALLAESFPRLTDARRLALRLPGLQTITDVYGLFRFLQAPYPAATIARQEAAGSASRSDRRKCILLKIPESGAMARYGNLVDQLESRGFSVVGEDFDREEIRDLDETYLRTARKVPFSERLRTIGQVLRLRLRLGAACRKINRPALKKSPIFSPSTFGLARRFTQMKSLQEAIDANRIVLAICVSSLAKPADRLLFQQLNRSRIPTALVFPRPVTRYRPAETPLALDLGRPDTLPDHFIVRDGSSRSQLIQGGLAADRIRVGAPSIVGAKVIWPDPNDRPAYQVIVLLPASEPDNVGLIGDLAEIASAHPALSLLVKGHPNSGLRRSEISALEALGLDWTDCSQRSMESIISPCALALTSCSTSVVEASLQGAAVVWAPLYSELAMPQLEFMENIGLIAQSRQHLIETLDRLLADSDALRKLAERCHESAHRLYACQSTIAERIFELLGEILDEPKANTAGGESG